ncbi:MAG: hypothetical protein KI790_11265 [Cyclobacteriaceae bacterium]|nr:hypothetical protein [Cyclobacteriaceae bacterium HetDA_MAG_MS6]
MASKISIYADLKDKKQPERELPPVESLIRTLDLMDFNAQLASQNPAFPKRSWHNVPEDLWIDLNYRSDVS